MDPATFIFFRLLHPTIIPQQNTLQQVKPDLAKFKGLKRGNFKKSLRKVFDISLFRDCRQCDQIGRFIGLWATFQSLWQKLICPNLPHSQAIFVKVSKSLIFLVKSFLGKFYRHLAIFTGHTVVGKSYYLLSFLPQPFQDIGNNNAEMILHGEEREIRIRGPFCPNFSKDPIFTEISADRIVYHDCRPTLYQSIRSMV